MNQSHKYMYTDSFETFNLAHIFFLFHQTSALTHFNDKLKQKLIFQLTGSWVHPGEYASSGKIVYQCAINN